MFLYDPDYLDSFQSGFRPGLGSKRASIAWMNELHWEKANGNATLLLLPGLSAASGLAV